MARASFVLVLSLLLLVACAPRDPGLRLEGPRPAVPSEVDRHDLTFTGKGVELYAQRWRPAGDGGIKGVVVIHHGLADHSARYTDLAVRLVNAGYASGLRLDTVRVHGPVFALTVTAERLHATSELGDEVEIDLTPLRAPYCELVRDIWERVPVMTDGDHTVRIPRPRGHRCTR